MAYATLMVNMHFSHTCSWIHHHMLKMLKSQNDFILHAVLSLIELVSFMGLNALPLEGGGAWNKTSLIVIMLPCQASTKRHLKWTQRCNMEDKNDSTRS